MKRLRTEVERVVAPVRANPLRKNRMREELLGHLTALYEVEATRHDTGSQAVAAALARFGDAGELTRSLQASVPLVERVLWFRFPGQDWQARRPDESAVGHILRTARYAVTVVAISNVVLIGVVAAISQFASRRSVPEKPPITNVATFLALCAIAQGAVMTIVPLCGELIHRATSIYRSSGSSGRARHAALIAAGLLMSTLVCTAAVAGLTRAFMTLLRIPIVTDRQFWWVVAAAATITLFVTALQSWQQAQASRQFDDLHDSREPDDPELIS